MSLRLDEFSDLIAEVAENGGMVAWGPGRSPIVLAPAGSASAIAPPAAAPGCPLPGRGGRLSRSVCGDCGTELLSTSLSRTEMEARHECE